MKLTLYKTVTHRTMLHFDNSGKYGKNFLECQILFVRGTFRAYLTDGYRFLNAGQCCDSLKEAIAFGQAALNKGAV